MIYLTKILREGFKKVENNYFDAIFHGSEGGITSTESVTNTSRIRFVLFRGPFLHRLSVVILSTDLKSRIDLVTFVYRVNK